MQAATMLPSAPRPYAGRCRSIYLPESTIARHAGALSAPLGLFVACEHNPATLDHPDRLCRRAAVIDASCRGWKRD